MAKLDPYTERYQIGYYFVNDYRTFDEMFQIAFQMKVVWEEVYDKIQFLRQKERLFELERSSNRVLYKDLLKRLSDLDEDSHVRLEVVLENLKDNKRPKLSSHYRLLREIDGKVKLIAQQWSWFVDSILFVPGPDDDDESSISGSDMSDLDTDQENGSSADSSPRSSGSLPTIFSSAKSEELSALTPALFSSLLQKIKKNVIPVVSEIEHLIVRHSKDQNHSLTKAKKIQTQGKMFSKMIQSMDDITQSDNQIIHGKMFSEHQTELSAIYEGVKKIQPEFKEVLDTSLVHLASSLVHPSLGSDAEDLKRVNMQVFDLLQQLISLYNSV